MMKFYSRRRVERVQYTLHKSFLYTRTTRAAKVAKLLTRVSAVQTVANSGGPGPGNQTGCFVSLPHTTCVDTQRAGSVRREGQWIMSPAVQSYAGLSSSTQRDVQSIHDVSWPGIRRRQSDDRISIE